MKKSIQISIPTPCHENWDAMAPTDKGRFCTSCQKTVIDFSNLPDREIAYVLKNTENACGRFRTAQLDRDLVVPKEKSTIWIAASAAVVSFLTIGNHTISAQTPVNSEQHVSETDEIVGKVASPQKSIITGTIVDEEGVPIPGANINIEGSQKIVKSDFDGTFSIEVIKGESLEISYVNMENQKITITHEKIYTIVMHNEVLSDVATDKYGGISIRRTFFGRIFHSIGNIFR